MKRVEKVLEHINKARELYQNYGQDMLENTIISAQVGRYKHAIDTTDSMFKKFGVSAACSKCAQEIHGSCCFEGMEENYNEILLLINLLLGVQLPLNREHKNQCFFIGSHGCKLVARYSFCVNYFCPKLEESLGQDKMARLAGVIGNEVFTGWELELAIKKWLDNQTIQ